MMEHNKGSESVDPRSPSELVSILDDIEDYTIQTAVGGSPFKTEEENDANNTKTYDEGRAKAIQQINDLIREETHKALEQERQHTRELLREARIDEISSVQLNHGRYVTQTFPNGEAMTILERIEQLKGAGE